MLTDVKYPRPPLPLVSRAATTASRTPAPAPSTARTIRAYPSTLPGCACACVELSVALHTSNGRMLYVQSLVHAPAACAPGLTSDCAAAASPPPPPPAQWGTSSSTTSAAVGCTGEQLSCAVGGGGGSCCTCMWADRPSWWPARRCTWQDGQLENVCARVSPARRRLACFGAAPCTYARPRPIQACAQSTAASTRARPMRVLAPGSPSVGLGSDCQKRRLECLQHTNNQGGFGCAAGISGLAAAAAPCSAYGRYLGTPQRCALGPQLSVLPVIWTHSEVTVHCRMTL